MDSNKKHKVISRYLTNGISIS